MKSAIETANIRLWIAMAIVVLSSVMAVRGQQAPASASSDSTATPMTAPVEAPPVPQDQIPDKAAKPATEQPLGQPATKAPKTVEHKWAPTTTKSALSGTTPAKTKNDKPAGTAGGTGSAVAQPTPETGTAPTTSAGEAIKEPETTSGTLPKGTVEEKPAVKEPVTTSGTLPKGKGAGGSAVKPLKTTSGTLPKGSESKGGSAIKAPKTVSKDAEKWQPGSTSNNAVPVVTEAQPDDATPGVATETALPADQPTRTTNFSTTVTDTPGTAIDQPGASSTYVVPAGDTGTALDPSKVAPEEVHHWLPGTDTSNALPSGEAKQPDMITPGTAAGAQPTTNTAIDQPATVTTEDQKWLPATNPNMAMPNTGDVKKPPMYTPGTAPGEQPNTNTAVQPPTSAGTHVWQPDANTNTAVTNVNTSQPQMFVPGVPVGQLPYIHTAVEAQHTKSAQFRFKGNMTPGVQKVVLVPPVDTRNFGNAMQQMTIEGHIVIDIPLGWRRTVGPGLLYFVQEKTPLIKNPLRSYDAAIYVGMGFIEPDERDRDALSFSSADAFIHSDIVGFKAKYKRAIIKESAPLQLPLSKVRHVGYIFESREQDNAYEEVIYIDEGNRILALTLSADNAKTFWSLVPAFHKFAQSYQGNIPDGTRTLVQ